MAISAEVGMLKCAMLDSVEGTFCHMVTMLLSLGAVVLLGIKGMAEYNKYVEMKTQLQAQQKESANEAVVKEEAAEALHQ